MRILFVILMFCLFLVPLAIADSGAMGKGNDGRGGKAPDSIVICEAQETTFRALNGTAPEGFSLDVCATGLCADCIRSLEKQGCNVVETDISPGNAGGDAPPGSPVGGDVGRSEPRVTFLLSCEKP